MAKPGIQDLLIRCVLDPEVLEQLRESPEHAFDEYDLSDREREILSSPDERLLELLGEAVGQRADEYRMEAQDQPAPAASDERTSAATSLPTSRLAVRLVPYVQQAAASPGEAPRVVVNYAGHLDPLPEGIDLDDLPDVPVAVTDGEQLPPVSVVVGVQPIVWTDDAGNTQMTFSVSAQLPQNVVAQDSADASDARLSPWQHDVASPAVEAAAERVHEANAGDRYRRLRELIDVMVTPAESTGAPR